MLQFAILPIDRVKQPMLVPHLPTDTRGNTRMDAAEAVRGSPIQSRSGEKFFEPQSSLILSASSAPLRSAARRADWATIYYARVQFWPLLGLFLTVPTHLLEPCRSIW